VNGVVVTLVPVLLLSAGCTVLLDPGEQQCQVDKDCTARGFSGATCKAGVCEKAETVDPVWGCLGNVVEPVPDPSKKVALSERLVLAGDRSAVTMATVDVCDKLDLDCTGTNPDFPKGLMPDSTGLVTFSVIQGFDGFIRIAGPDVMDSRVFVGRPVVKPPAVKEVRLLQPNDYQILAAFAKQTVDPTRGTAILYEVDCQGLAASGVKFKTPNADSQSLEFYLINQAPEAPPTATSTDVDGFGGFFNLPVGAAVAQGYRAKDDAYIGESSFQVLANTISYVQIAPTPK
jgi:hypothetical protein